MGSRLFVLELQEIASQHRRFTVHFVDTTTAAHLTADSILSTVSAGTPASTEGDHTVIHDLSVFLCGPDSMKSTLTEQFKKRGVKPINIHAEYFAWR
ncbi:MAG: hypothetical protein SPI14_04805 [Arcanobacterium sp.]|nr:hypothetical protein [Arcanobacterium sp.]